MQYILKLLRRICLVSGWLLVVGSFFTQQWAVFMGGFFLFGFRVGLQIISNALEYANEKP